MSWITGLWVMAACSSPPPLAEVAGRSGLIVVHADGSLVATCVEWKGGEMSGEDLLEASGISLTRDTTNPMGPLVCSIDGDGCDYPRETCLCRCRGAGACSYWAYFNWNAQEGWSYAALGAGQRSLRDGDMDAWVWLDRALPGQDPPLPEMTFDTVCG